MTKDPASKNVKRIQSGCVAKLYLNNGSRLGTTLKLYHEIKKCSIMGTIKDVGGSFTLYLHPTEPWDEIIKGDDYIRIFMGDEVSSTDVSEGAFNLSNQDSYFPIGFGSELYVPLIGSGSTYSDGNVTYNKTINAPKTLMMYEKFLGKIDRVQKIVRGPNKNQGTTVSYVVSGRTFGAILQDSVIAYNEFIVGLNAISVWANEMASVREKSPSELVKKYLTSLLTTKPMPQFQLPDALIEDYMDIKAAIARSDALFKAMYELTNRIGDQIISNPTDVAAIKLLQQFINDGPSYISNSPMMILNLDNILPTYGKNLDDSWLTNVSSGSYDFVRNLSNPQFNEFFFDLLPDGDVNGGTADSDRAIPSFVMRQRPYDITEDMVKGLADSVDLSSYTSSSSVSSSLSLMDLMDASVIVTGPMGNPKDMIAYQSNKMVRDYNLDRIEYEPDMLDYQMGYTSVARFNSYLCLGAFSSGRGSMDGQKLLMTGLADYPLDIDSIARYGYRHLEVTTPYATPSSAEMGGHLKTMQEFTAMLSNWYSLNPYLLDGTITCRFLKEARLGVPCVYLETRLSVTNPFPKLEISYIQAVQHDYEFGKPLTTTLTLTRGLKYDLTKPPFDLTDIVAVGARGANA